MIKQKKLINTKKNCKKDIKKIFLLISLLFLRSTIKTGIIIIEKNNPKNNA